MNKPFVLAILLSGLLFAACGPSAGQRPTPVSPAASTPAVEPSPAPVEPTAASTVELKTIVTGTTSCRFGPDTIYIPRFRVGVGTFRVGGRDESGQWLLIYPLQNSKTCWIETRFTNLDGQVANIPVTPARLEVNPDYGPPDGIKATRLGTQVQVLWNDVTLQAADAPPSNRFLLDLWLCSAGQLTHMLLATNHPGMNVPDEPGCAEKSHGQIYTATRRGYSIPAEIPWPAP